MKRAIASCRSPAITEPGLTYYNGLDKMDGSPPEYGHSIQNKCRTPSQHYADVPQPHNSTGIGEDQISFFDFDPPLSSSPFAPISTTAELFSSWNFHMQHPLSPPLSALSSSPKGKLFSENAHAPPNILTDIDSANNNAHYGQITPPDDEGPSLFPHQPAKPPFSDGPRKRKRLSPSAKELAMSPSPKRARKNAALSTSVEQTVDSSDIEQLRRSKFLERNRVAASKCRQKKKQWIDKLETQLREHHARHNSLRLLVDSLKNEVLYLKVEMVAHMGCNVPSITQRIERDRESFEKAIETYNQLARDKKYPDDAECPPAYYREEVDASVDSKKTKVTRDDVIAIKSPSSPSPFEDIVQLEELLLDDLGQNPREG